MSLMTWSGSIIGMYTLQSDVFEMCFYREHESWAIVMRVSFICSTQRIAVQLPQARCKSMALKANDLARSGQLELPRPQAVAPHQRNRRFTDGFSEMAGSAAFLLDPSSVLLLFITSVPVLLAKPQPPVVPHPQEMRDTLSLVVGHRVQRRRGTGVPEASADERSYFQGVDNSS